MKDMREAIVPRSDQQNAEDFLAGPRVFTIKDVSIRPGTEQPVSIQLVEDERVWRPCKSMSRVLVSAWGPDANQYIGRSVRLYCDPTVTWGGMKVGGIRISHMSHIEQDLVLALTATKGRKVVATIKPITVDRGYTIDQARIDMGGATTTDELKAVWQNKAIAPHREALSDFLTECKEAIADSEAKAGRTDAEHGDQRDGVTDGEDMA